MTLAGPCGRSSSDEKYVSARPGSPRRGAYAARRGSSGTSLPRMGHTIKSVEHRWIIAGDFRWNRERVSRPPSPSPPRDMIAILRSAFGFRCACRVGLRRGVTRRSDRGSGSRLWSPRGRAAPRRSGSIERKGKKSFRQTRIPEASRRYKDQGSMISVRDDFSNSPAEYS